MTKSHQFIISRLVIAEKPKVELVALLRKRLVKYPDYLNVLLIVCVHKLHLFQLPDQISAGEVDVSVLLFASNTCDMVVTASRRQTLYLAAVSCCVFSSCPANVRRHQIKCLVCDLCRCGSNTQRASQQHVWHCEINIIKQRLFVYTSLLSCC